MSKNAHITEPAIRVHRVLACVGSSPWLESQVETVARLAGALGSELTFLHVNLPGSDAAGVKARIETALSAHQTRAEVITISSSRPDKTILREVTRRGVNLVYAGAAPHEPILTDIMGSTARRIARGARCSVLLDSDPKGREGRFSTTIAAVHTDGASKSLLDQAAQLVRAGIISNLHVVHEVQPAPHSAIRADSSGAWQITRARADAELRELITSADLAGVPIKATCVEGRQNAGVINYAERYSADLVICLGPSRRIRTLGRLVGNPYETLLTDLPSALLLFQPSRRHKNEVQ